MIEVNSFAELRTTKPPKAGEIAMLRRYYGNDNNFNGGGEFAGFISTTPPKDDSGTIAVGNGFYWKRVINNPEELNVLHFGARGDGWSNDTAAFKSMMEWTQSYHKSIKSLPVRFPSGRFLIDPLDYSATEMPIFYIYGDDNPHGALPRTTIISNQSSNPVFKVKARRTAIKGIAWDGRASADIKTITGPVQPSQCTNQQPFFENTIVAGQSVVISRFRAQNNGGTVIKLQDTLDSKFDQIYTITTFGRIFEVGWSGTATGVWDHATAIELTNANFQTGYGDGTLMMPRVTQGVINNVWIEHTRNPGDLSEGQWLIDALSIETCAQPLKLRNSRVQFRQLNLQSGSKVDLERDMANRWLSEYEYGWRRDENYGTEFTGSMKAGWYSGYRVSNTSSTDKWFKLGRVHTPIDNQQWVFEIVSKATNDVPGSVSGNPVTTVASAVTWLNVSRCAPAIYADMQHKGGSAVLEARIGRLGIQNAEVWVKLKARCGDVVFNVTTTGPTRFEKGITALFTPDLSEVTDLNTLGDITANARMSLHNGLAGIGANEKGVLTVATPFAPAPKATQPKGYILVNLNGTDRVIPYY